MGLTCECGDWYPEPGDWYYPGHDNDGYIPFPFKRRRKCCSCGEHISPGGLSVEHKRVKVPESDIELDIYGEDGEIPIASDWMCESCGDLFFSLDELGYCVNPRDNMKDLVDEYSTEHAKTT